MSPILLIAGASVRAAAWSAARAGYLPVAADRFGDADLSSLAQATRLDSYPDGPVALHRGPRESSRVGRLHGSAARATGQFR